MALELILLVVGAVLGGVIGILFSSLLQKKLDKYVDRHRRLRRLRLVDRQLIQQDSSSIQIAGFRTGVHLVEGDGQLVLEPANVRIRFDPSPAELPVEVQRSKGKTIQRLAAERQSTEGVAPTWDSGTLAALCRYRITRTEGREESSLDLTVSPTDYATFVATVLSLDDEPQNDATEGIEGGSTLRENFLPNSMAVARAVERPLPFLANGVGVSLLVFTDDKKIILTRRRTQAKARPGQRDVSVVEGLHTQLDMGLGGALDVYIAAARGCEEELGIRVELRDIKILALAVDMEYYQWNFVGLVEARYSAAEIVELHSLHARDRWESRLEIVPDSPGTVFDLLKQDGIWDMGLITIYLAFCYRSDPGKVREAFMDIYGGSPAERPWRA